MCLPHFSCMWINNFWSLNYMFQYFISHSFHFRLRLCPQSCLTARNCVLWTWETIACRRCLPALANLPGWPSWSWGETVSSVSQSSLGNVGCWRRAAWWWRRTCSTRCHQKSKSSFGGLTRSKLEVKLSGKLQRREVKIGETVKTWILFTEAVTPWRIYTNFDYAGLERLCLVLWLLFGTVVVQMARPSRMYFWKINNLIFIYEEIRSKLGDERCCCNLAFLQYYPECKQCENASRWCLLCWSKPVWRSQKTLHDFALLLSFLLMSM